MRKSLIFILLLLALSALGLGYAQSTVNAAKEDVKLTETTLLGHSSAAKGLSVHVRTHCQNHLFWDTTLHPGQSPTTDFLFSKAKVREKGSQNTNGIQIYLNTNMSASSSGMIAWDDNLGISNMVPIYKDVASRTKKGQTHMETIYMKDYYDFYPLAVDLFLPSHDYPWDQNKDAAILRQIAAYFQFPVLEKQQLEITITKDDAGNVVELGSTCINGTDVWVDSPNASTDDSCYFSVSAVQADPTDHVLLDYSHVPGGYGIYRIPFGSQENPTKLTIDDMTMFYPLAATEQILQLQTSADKTKLLLLTQEQNTYILKVLEAKTGKELQRIPLMNVRPETSWVNPFYIDQDFLAIFFGDKKFLVLQATDQGTYELQYTGTLPDEKNFSFNHRYDSVMDFDGEKLAIASINEDQTSGTSCGFSLVVLDQTGILYAARYDSDLDKGQPLSYRDRCNAMDYKPLTLQWK